MGNERDCDWMFLKLAKVVGSNQPSISLWPRTSGVAKTSRKVTKSHQQCLDSIHSHLPSTGLEVAMMHQDVDQY